MESKLQVSATPLVPFVQTLAHRTPLIEHERENLIYIYQCNMYSIYADRKMSYEVEHIRTNKITGNVVRKVHSYATFERALQRLSV